MLNTYEIRMADKLNYGKLIGGHMDAKVLTIKVSAENEDKAIEIAKISHPTHTYVLRVKDVKAIEEEERRQAEESKARKEQELERVAKAKTTKLANELAKAEELGMSVDEYREFRKLELKIKREKEKIANLEKQLRMAKINLARLEKQMGC